MPPGRGSGACPPGGYPRKTVSETGLSVICKNCGSEVSPYVTECPYCGARLRKRAPKLERRGDALEAKPRRRAWPRLRRRRPGAAAAPRRARPYATLAAILVPAALLLAREASGDPLSDYGGLAVPFADEWWRYLTAPFAYSDVGYLFVVALGLAIFALPLERRLGTPATALLLVACGSLGALAAGGIADAQGGLTVIAGGNGTALGALAAWFAIRRSEAGRAIDQDYDAIGLVVAAAVLLALPIFQTSANVFAGLVGGAVGGLAGLAAAALRPAGE
jgi:membrane associated rhomboid family serine protease